MKKSGRSYFVIFVGWMIILCGEYGSCDLIPFACEAKCSLTCRGNAQVTTSSSSCSCCGSIGNQYICEKQILSYQKETCTASCSATVSLSDGSTASPQCSIVLSSIDTCSSKQSDNSYCSGKAGTGQVCGHRQADHFKNISFSVDNSPPNGQCRSGTCSYPALSFAVQASGMCYGQYETSASYTTPKPTVATTIRPTVAPTPTSTMLASNDALHSTMQHGQSIGATSAVGIAIGVIGIVLCGLCINCCVKRPKRNQVFVEGMVLPHATQVIHISLDMVYQQAEAQVPSLHSDSSSREDVVQAVAVRLSDSMTRAMVAAVPMTARSTEPPIADASIASPITDRNSRHVDHWNQFQHSSRNNASERNSRGRRSEVGSSTVVVV